MSDWIGEIKNNYECKKGSGLLLAHLENICLPREEWPLAEFANLFKA